MAFVSYREAILGCVILVFIQTCFATEFCYQCQADTYCFLETQYQCPANSISSALSSNISDCVCIDSYYETDHLTGECAQCQPGFFCVGEKSYPCPEHTISQAGSFDASHCLCVEGYTLSGHENSTQGQLPVCTPCVAGKYKDHIGYEACNECVVGTYSTTVAAESDSHCVSCPLNHVSSAASDEYADCVSDVGFYQNETLWTTMQIKYAEMCRPGTYQDEVGKFECKRCDDLNPPAQTSLENSDSPQDCVYCFEHSFTYSSLTGNITDCTCNSGYYTQSPQVCVECTAGKYSDTNDVDVCLTCGVNQYSQTAATSCENCPLNSHSNAGSTSIEYCICDAGFEGSGGSCSGCNSGYFTLVSSLEATCTACYPDHYMDGLQCKACPPNSFSSTLSTSLSDCSCNVGYEQKNDQVECEICPAGKFYDTSTKLCIACVPDTYNMVPGATHCTACPSASTTNGVENAHTRSMCLCGSGYEGQIYEDSGSCVGCAYGKYKNTLGNGLCQVCDAGTYSDEIGSLTCKSCMANSYSEIEAVGPEDCICLSGYQKDGDDCVPCASGYYKNQTGNFACFPCAAGTYANWVSDHANESRISCFDCPVDTYQDLTASESCKTCIQHSSSTQKSKNIDDCLCSPGHYKDTDDGNNVCVECALGYFKATTSDDACEKCPAGHTTSAPGTIVGSACIACGDSQYEVGGICVQCYENSTSEEGSAGIISCECRAGFYRYSSSKCYECERGTYAPAIGMQECLLCPEGTIGSELSPGVLRNQIHGDDSACVPCGANQYYVNHQTCNSCPMHSTSPPSSLNIGQCVCDIGYERVGNECVQCQAGYYKAVKGNDACVECSVGHYQPLIGSSNCLQCPQNKSTTGTGLSSIESCLCNPGYKYVSTETCVLCEDGTFKSTHSNTDACVECMQGTYFPTSSPPYVENLCQVCPGEKISDSGAFGVNSCKCDVGYYESESHTCVPCTSGFYCPGGGSKIACPTNAGSYPASSTANNCYCMPGYYTEENSCVLCPVNSYCNEDARTIVDGKIVQEAERCPSNSTTLTKPGQVSLRNCICDAGFYRDNNVCKSCPVNTYCYNETKIKCMNNATSVRLSSSADECKCDAGYEKNLEQCILCASNQVCHHSVTTFKIRFRVLIPMLPNAVTDEIKFQILTHFAKTLKIETHRINGLFTQMKIYTVANRRLLADQTELFVEVESETLHESNQIQGEVQAMSANDYSSPLASAQYVSSVTIVSAYEDEMSDEQCAEYASNINQKCVCSSGKYCNYNGSCSGEFATCVDCTAGSYCAQNLISACPPNFDSPGNSTGIKDCFCRDGFYTNAQNECVQCMPNNYCKHGNSTQCSIHDRNLISLAGSVTWSDCKCTPGYFRISPYDSCKPCPLDHYCPDESGYGLPNIFSCPENEFTYETRQVERTQCICIAGFVLSESDNTLKCLPCQEGERCSAGQVLETQCHIQNRIANADHSKCVCHIGYEQTANGECQLCPVGKFKSDIGDQACEFCPPNNIMVNDVCEPCRNFATARPGDTECICQAPRVLVNNTCELCPENYVWSQGSFTNQAGYIHPVCAACPAHSSTQSEFGVTNMNDCLCENGYVRGTYVNDSFCVPCPKNSYEENGLCVVCGENAISLEASHGKLSCFCNSTLCQKNVWSDICSERCETPPDECEECAIGQFKSFVSSVGNHDECTLCGYAKYQPSTGQSHCLSCPATRTHSILESVTVEDCQCDMGYEDRDADLSTIAHCYECNAGFFKEEVGNHACAACGIGLFADQVQSTSCKQCHEFSPVTGANTTKFEASISESNCTCDFGFFNTQQRCERCESGSFKHFKGFEECVFCGTVDELYGNVLLNKYGDGELGAISSTHCLHCPENSGQNHELIPEFFVMSEFHTCMCFPGFHQRNDTLCVACGEKQVQPYFSLANCEFCAAGKYFVASNLFCPTCSLTFEPRTEESESEYTNVASNNSLQLRHTGLVLNSVDESLVFGESELDCICEVGYERKFALSYNYDCILCPTGSSRGTLLQRHCAECPIDTYTPYRGSLECLQCPLHSSTMNLTGRNNILDCVCDLGFFWNSTHCVPCEAGTFRNVRDLDNEPTVCSVCLVDHYCPENSIQPIPCSANEFSLENSQVVEDCKCVEGHGRSLDSQVCATCPHAFYSARGVNICEACPDHKNTSEIGSISIDACFCIPGFGQDTSQNSDPCVACGDGFYAPGGENIPCDFCGWGARSDPEVSAVSLDQCYCDGTIGVRLV